MQTPMTHQDAIRTMASERYLLDEMNEQERDRFEEHLFTCAACAEDVRVVDLIREESGAASASPAVRPAASVTVLRPKRTAWRPLVALPWAAAASLAVLAGYQSLVTVPALEELGEPRALSGVVLRGSTRAADVVVPIVEGQRFITLMPDVIVNEPTRRLSFDLRGPEGNALVSGLVSAPSPGAPFVLLVPADKLARTGRHVLTVRDADRPQTLVGEYAFVTSP